MKWNSPPPYHLLSPFGMTAFYQPTLCYEAVKPRTASPQRMGHPHHREGQKKRRKAGAPGTRPSFCYCDNDLVRCYGVGSVHTYLYMQTILARRSSLEKLL